MSTSDAITDLIGRALAEDVGSGDLTTAAVVPAGTHASATIEQRERGVLSGLEIARDVFARLDAAVGFEPVAAEGEWREPGPVARLAGPAAAILTGERVALNLLGRLSGIATLTRRYVDAIEGTGATILDTRKTTPGMRALEKAAVRAGGGRSHRSGLHDAILVKENHVRIAGGVSEAARRALHAATEGVVVEVEVETLAELDEALEAGIQRVLLDNMAPDGLREAVERAGGRAELEASGGVTLGTVRAIAETGVDFISVGALTHSARSLDLSLLFEPE